MGTIAILLFSGLTALALISGVHYAEDPAELIGWTAAPPRSPASSPRWPPPTFGINIIPFFIIQAATALVLLLAANTAFNGFPLLGSVLAQRRLRAQGPRTPAATA